ncbi:hypothetical protein Tco_1099086 [Tanacetum coccineum]
MVQGFYVYESRLLVEQVLSFKGGKVLQELSTSMFQLKEGYLVGLRRPTIKCDIVMFGNMVYFENERYMDTLKGLGVGKGSMQTLHGVEFEVEPQEDRGFEVERLGSCDMVDGS